MDAIIRQGKLSVDSAEFKAWRNSNIESINKNAAFTSIADQFYREQLAAKYSYNFEWLGVPIIQLPTDLVVVQEVIYEAKANVIIETGTARGGSAIFYRSILELMGVANPRVITIDIEVRPHTSAVLENHRLSKGIISIVGNSTEQEIAEECHKHLLRNDRVMVMLDSNHEYGHVLRELDLYARFVNPSSYIVVFDTSLGFLRPEEFRLHREKMYDRVDFTYEQNTATSVQDFLKSNVNWRLNSYWENKALITNCKMGFLQRVV